MLRYSPNDQFLIKKPNAVSCIYNIHVDEYNHEWKCSSQYYSWILNGLSSSNNQSCLVNCIHGANWLWSTSVDFHFLSELFVICFYGFVVRFSDFTNVVSKFLVYIWVLSKISRFLDTGSEFYNKHSFNFVYGRIDYD